METVVLTLERSTYLLTRMEFEGSDPENEDYSYELRESKGKMKLHDHLNTTNKHFTIQQTITPVVAEVVAVKAE